MKKVSLATIALVLLATSLFAAIPMAGAISSPSDPNATIYAHYDSPVALNSGKVGYTTQKFHSSTQTTVDTTASSTTQMVWSFNMYPGLAAGVTVPASSSFSVVAYINANASLSGVTVGAQMNEYCGSDSSPWGGEVTTIQSLTTAVTAYTVTVSTGGSAVSVNSGCSFHTVIYVSPGTTHHETITISYDSSSAPTHSVIPLNEYKSVIDANSVSSVATETDVVTASASDAFGLYDLGSVTFTASAPGGQTVVNAGTMTETSGTPTSATGAWTYSLTPFTTAYQNWPGTWSIYSTLTDQSGNTLQSPTINLIYDFGGSGQTTTTSSSGPSVGGRTFSPSDPVLDIIIALVIVLAAIGLYKAAKRK